MNTCSVCGRRLTNPVSIDRGMGPVCARKQAMKERQKREPREHVMLETDYDGLVCEKQRRLTELGFEVEDFVTNIPRVITVHSPDGFAWGYLGSGPHDLALNTLLHFKVSQTLAKRIYNDFVWEVISRIPEEGGKVPGDEIRAFIKKKMQEVVAA